MKKNYKKTSFVYLLFLFLVQFPASLFATHVQGGDITYACLGGNQYKIIMSFYRDCAGVAAPATIDVNVKSASCNKDYSITLTRIPSTGIEVSPICPTLKTVCTGGTFPGVEEYIYTGITTLPAACTDWVFSADISARNAAVSTIVDPANQNLYIESKLNNKDFPCNNSPSFTNKPVPFICVGQPFCFNNGALDPDGDSLAYRLVTPMNGAGQTVTYISPYSATQPLLSAPPVSFNAKTGDICMTPTQLEVTVFAVIVEEYRGGKLVGSVVRDIQLRTVTCNNNNPVLTGINGGGKFSINGCIGVPLTFTIPSSDADAAQKVVLTWNAGIAGATFDPGTGTRPTGTFTWTPTLADLDNVSNCFTVRVLDDNCPFNGSQTYSFCITLSNVTVTGTVKDANCTTANGSATVVAKDGILPYKYAWAPSGGTNPTATALVAGTYTVTVTDANGCSKTLPATVKSIPGGTASVSTFSNVSCNGTSDGTITVSVSGAGTPPFAYAWTPNVGTTATVKNLPVGTYSCTVTDAFGCKSTITQVISQPTVMSIAPTNTNVSCFGGANGTATATVTGGTPGYTYSWMPGGFSTSSISSLSLGTYTVNITDSKGCKKSATVNISQPPILQVAATTVDATCSKANGEASVTGSGGFAPYTWSWSSGQTVPTVQNLAAGTYTVTIKDVSLCTVSVPVTIKNIAGPKATITAFTNTSCNGGNDGSATITVTGGKAPFKYLWNNGQTTPSATNLVAGIYSVVATDANGCAATVSITITQPLPLIANAVGTSPVCFNDRNGAAQVSVTGGTPGYTYLWALPRNPTKDTIQNLGAGIYNVTVTDANGCVKVASVTLVNPKIITTSVTNTNVLCFGSCTGTATASAANGFTPYTYLWSNSTNQTTATATGLCVGTYSVTILDAHGCKSQASTTIGAPTELTSTVSLSGNTKCFGGNEGFAEVIAAGGIPPYAYSWMPGGATTPGVSGLTAGSYTCTITDANGCTSKAIAKITEPSKLVATVTGTNIRCNGSCDGAGAINFTGGVAPYSFLWTPGLQTTFNPNNLCLGSNTATITDANGCKVSGTVLLTQPLPLNVTTTITNSTCGYSNGGACASVTGGASPYKYLWDTLGPISVVGPQTACINGKVANTYNVSVTDANGCISTVNANIDDDQGPTVAIASSTNLECHGASTGTAVATVVTTGGIGYTATWTPGGQIGLIPTTLKAGINTITVKDKNGCVSSESVLITEPIALVSAVTGTTDVTCNSSCDGSSTILYGGGSPPYTVKWSDPAAQTTDKAINLCAGTYSVTITDTKGCKLVNSATIIAQPDALAIPSAITTDIRCFGSNDGFISASVKGGTPFYTYTWTPNVSQGAVATNLAPGSYSLNILDMNGCTTNKSWTIKEPLKLTATHATIPSTCSKSNGEATVTVAGGTTAYNYQWNDPALQKTGSAKNLHNGTYICVVTDALGCKLTDTALVNDEPGPIIDSMKSTPALCYGDNKGTATVIVKPGTGTAPITFIWPSTSQTNATNYGLIQGTYTVLVKDANGCTTNGTVIVNQPHPLSLTVSVSDTICYGDTAQIYAQAFGGTPSYSYLWTVLGGGLTGSGPHLVSPTKSMFYPVSVKDANGCTAGPVNVSIHVLDPLRVVATDVEVCEGKSVVITANVTGGTDGPYTYLWTNGSKTKSQTVTPKLINSPVSYIVVVDDGCSNSAYDTATVKVNPGSKGSLVGFDTAGCQPLKVQFIAASDNGITYVWHFGDGKSAVGLSPTHIYQNDGVYTVTVEVKTSKGCITPIVDTNYITVYPLPEAAFSSNPSVTTFISPTVEFSDLSTPTITAWKWNFDDPSTDKKNLSILKNPTHVFSGIGIYEVELIVTTQYGCVDTVIQPYDVKDDYVFYIPNTFTPNGDGFNEEFMPKVIGYDVRSFRFYIFDRWGNFIFYSEDATKGWDGRANHGIDIAQEDVYVWKVNVKDKSGRIHKYMGHVNIIK